MHHVLKLEERKEVYNLTMRVFDELMKVQGCQSFFYIKKCKSDTQAHRDQQPVFINYKVQEGLGQIFVVRAVRQVEFPGIRRQMRVRDRPGRHRVNQQGKQTTRKS